MVKLIDLKGNILTLDFRLEDITSYNWMNQLKDESLFRKELWENRRASNTTFSSMVNTMSKTMSDIVPLMSKKWLTHLNFNIFIFYSNKKICPVSSIFYQLQMGIFIMKAKT